MNRLCVLLCLGLSLASSTVRAETGSSSSWSKRTILSKQPARAPITGITRKIIPNKSQAPSGQPPRSKTPLGKTMVKPSGENAAYIAFDQGQYLTAKKIAEERVKKNDPQAHTLLGRIYAEGLGVKRDELQAAKWYRRGAELGDTEAMFAFGVILASGTAVKRNHDGAAQMFEQAALKGHVLAHYNLALQFLSGKGKPENPRRAALHLEYAAGKGIAEAQYDLAALYQRGHGVEPDAFKSAFWLQKAADKGMPTAQFEYAVALLRGRGLNPDKPKIMDYLTAAAAAGIAGAQNRMARIYMKGLPGVSRDPQEAAKWHIVARANGIADKELDAFLAKQPKPLRDKAAAAAHTFQNRRLVGLAASQQ